MKDKYIFQNKNHVKIVFCNIFAKLFYFWLNRRQLDSHICFCIQSVAIQCVS